MASTKTTVEGDPLFPGSKYILVLGGGSKLATYIQQSTKNYNNTKVECIHLRSKECLKYNHMYKTYSDYFKRSRIDIIGICPLTDSLIPFADAMNALWHLPHNDPKTSQRRRNKALMHKTISQSNHQKLKTMKRYFKNIINQSNSIDTNSNEDHKDDIRYGKFFEINNYLISKERFSQKMKDHNLQYPLVIKPPTSGGTDGVRLCYTFEAAQKVVQKHLFQENSEKNTNTFMMAQEFLDGDEYVVNTVSFNSIHKVSDVWRAHKTFIVDKTTASNDEKDINDEENNTLYPYSMLYDYQQFVVDLNTERMQLIVDYVFSILDVLGVQYGCGHSEVIYLNNENQVCLVELNARCGGGIPRAKECVGYDQYGLVALSYIDSDRFVKQIPKVYTYAYDDDDDDDNKEEEKETVRVIFCQSNIDGRIDFNKLKELEELKTFKKFAREFVYVGMEIWLKYKIKLLLAQQQLNHVTDIEQQTFAQMDYAGFSNIDDAAIDSLEQEKEECNHQIESFKRTIGRIEKIEKTVDLISSPGAIVLQGLLKDIENDYNTIRTLEQDTTTGLFIDAKIQTYHNIYNDDGTNGGALMLTMCQLIENGFTMNEARMALELSLNEK